MNSLHNRNKQHGAALLVLFLMLFTASSTLFLSSVNTNIVETRRQQNIRTEMEMARQALLAYAVNYHHFGFDNDGDTFTDDEGPGRFPCPDIDNDGLADSTVLACTDNVRGRLPVDISYGGGNYQLNNSFAPVDQQFWYVVSPTFKEIVTTGINGTSAGTLSIDGTGGYVAVLIAPGDALLTQDRAASNTNVANYLEQDNQAGTAFINSYPADPDAFNDVVTGITFNELKTQIVIQAGQALGEKLKKHYDTLTIYPVNTLAISVYLLVEGPLWFYGAPQDNWLADLTYNNIPPASNISWYFFNSCPSIFFIFIDGSDLIISGDSC